MNEQSKKMFQGYVKALVADARQRERMRESGFDTPTGKAGSYNRIMQEGDPKLYELLVALHSARQTLGDYVLRKVEKSHDIVRELGERPLNTTIRTHIAQQACTYNPTPPFEHYWISFVNSVGQTTDYMCEYCAVRITRQQMSDARSGKGCNCKQCQDTVERLAIRFPF